MSLKDSSYGLEVHCILFCRIRYDSWISLQIWFFFLFPFFTQFPFFFVANIGKALYIGRYVRIYVVSGGIWCSRCCKFGLCPLPYRGQMGGEASSFLSKDPDTVHTHLHSLTLSRSVFLQILYWTLSAFWGSAFWLLSFKYSLRKF